MGPCLKSRHPPQAGHPSLRSGSKFVVFPSSTGLHAGFFVTPFLKMTVLGQGRPQGMGEAGVPYMKVAMKNLVGLTTTAAAPTGKETLLLAKRDAFASKAPTRRRRVTPSATRGLKSRT